MGGSDSESTSEWKPPDWTIPRWQEGIDRAHDLYQQYSNGADLSWQGDFASPLVQEQVDAIGGLRGMALPMVGNPAYLQRNADTRNNLVNSAMSGSMVNPYGGASNPYGGATNPAFENAINAMRGNAEKTFGRTTGAATDAAAAMAGAYGGSGYDEFKNAQSKELADSLNLAESGMRDQQMNRAAGLWSQDIGRNAGLAEAGFGRQLQALGLTPSLQAGDVNLLNSLLSAGGVSRDLDQLQLEGAIGRHDQNSMQDISALNLLLDSLARASGGGGTSTTRMKGNSGGLLGLFGL